VFCDGVAMSEVSNQARAALAELLADDTRRATVASLQTALQQIQALQPRDAYDESVVFEAGETVLRMIESFRRRKA
jgi:hypothetical protein